MDQGEADSFNSGKHILNYTNCYLDCFAEFKSRANRNLSGMFGGGQYTPERRAIEGGRNHHEPRQSGSSAPIITVPDDDSDEEIQEIRTTRYVFTCKLVIYYHKF
jgi:hypothetical protein